MQLLKLPLVMGLLLICATSLTAQYAPPLRGPLLITGTFGELRSNHFHGGLDFRAAVGTPVYAVNDGYISRIRVSGGGYGQAIYVDHPDGKRSVYGHLETLAPALEDSIRALQYARESFEIDLELDSLSFPVKQGQHIGGVGNRGFSFGPHLHFEIREAAGDVPLNPLSLGFAVADTRLPEIQRLRIYELSDTEAAIATKTYDLHRRELPDTVHVSSPRVGLGFKAYDRQNSMPNRNGIYRASLRVDSSEHFSLVYDRIPYDKTEYLNALTDFADWKENKSWYYLLHTPTPAAIFWPGGDPSQRGVIRLLPGSPVDVVITAGDHAGNETAVRFTLLYEEGTAPATAPELPYSYYLPAGERSIIDTAGMRLELPAEALYRDLKFSFVHLADGSDNHLSDTYQLHEYTTPLHGKATLTIRPRREISAALKAKVYVGKCDDTGKHRSVGGKWCSDGSMTTTIGSMGDYALMIDSVAPRIRIERFSTDLRRAGGFSLLIDDAVGGALSYRATVDGEWLLMEYDAKSGRLSHNFAHGRPLGAGRHQFELSVRDARGNEATFGRSFTR